MPTRTKSRFLKKQNKMALKFSGQYFRKSMETDSFENMHPDVILLFSYTEEIRNNSATLP